MYYFFSFMKRFPSNSLAAILILIFCIASFTAGCAATVPVVVNLMDKGRQYTATLEVSKSADEIYRIVVRELEKIPDVRIVRKDDSKFFIEASRADKNTRITASPASNGKSRVTITADAGNTWEESKDLASRAVRRICEEVQMRCQLIVK